jgi:glutamate:GABA antiporter
VFPAAFILRRKHPAVVRPFRLPGKTNIPMFACTALITFWVTLGSWTAVFPGTLNTLFGLHYSFADSWGVSEGKFLLFTLGTLAVLVLFSLAGYWAASGVRAKTVDVALGAPPPGVAVAPA